MHIKLNVKLVRVTNMLALIDVVQIRLNSLGINCIYLYQLQFKKCSLISISFVITQLMSTSIVLVLSHRLLMASNMTTSNKKYYSEPNISTISVSRILANTIYINQ